MNWDKIKEKYPKAWEKCDNFIGCTWLELWHKESIYVLSGWLFRFFDEQGIYITVAFNNEFGQGEFHQYWIGEIDIKIEEDEYTGDYFERSKTRIEAEEKAFEQAFSILESKAA